MRIPPIVPMTIIASARTTTVARRRTHFPENLLRALVPREVLWRAEWGLPRLRPVDRFVNAEYRRPNWFCREFETRPLIRDREISMPKNIVLCCDGTAERVRAGPHECRQTVLLRLIQIRRVK